MATALSSFCSVVTLILLSSVNYKPVAPNFTATEKPVKAAERAMRVQHFKSPLFKLRRYTGSKRSDFNYIATCAVTSRYGNLS